MNVVTPKVFISYSHDTPDHKTWVSKLSTVLRENGIDIILDQWDLGYGDDLASFMERGVYESDRVLVICTDEYNRRADAGIGGVGYEKMVVTADLIKDISTNKFVPVIRKVTGEKKTPVCLSTRMYYDLSTKGEKELCLETLKDLIADLHEVPNETKPKLGKNPFTKTSLGHDIKPITTAIEISGHQRSPKELYKIAVELARANDILGWRQLVKDIKGPIAENLNKWKEKYEATPPNDIATLQLAVDEAVGNISSLLIIALTGVESGRDALKDQRSLLDIIYNIVGWNRAGRTCLVHLPRALTYLYHSLHGAMAVSTGQYDLIINMANMPLQDATDREAYPLWKTHSVMGWTDALGGYVTKSWEYLVNSCSRWEWLKDMFGSEFEFKISLIAYYMSLNLFEMADTIANLENRLITDTTLHLDIPLCNLAEKSEMVNKASQLIITNNQSARRLWTAFKVTDNEMVNSWPKWIEICKVWLHKVYDDPWLAHHGIPNVDLLGKIINKG